VGDHVPHAGDLSPFDFGCLPAKGIGNPLGGFPEDLEVVQDGVDRDRARQESGLIAARVLPDATGGSRMSCR